MTPGGLQMAVRALMLKIRLIGEYYCKKEISLTHSCLIIIPDPNIDPNIFY